MTPADARSPLEAQARDRQQLLDDDLLLHDRLELVVDDEEPVERTRREVVDRLLRDGVRARRIEPREDADVLAANAEPAPAEEVAALAPDEHQLDLLRPACSTMNVAAALMTFELKLPASPLSPETTSN